MNGKTTQASKPRLSKADKFFWSGIAVGVLLTFAGALTKLLPQFGASEARLILCSGLGIVLGTFGSMATVKYKGVTIAGAAAIAVIFWYLIEWRGDTLTIVRGQITGDIRGATVEVYHGKPYHGAFLKDHIYDFVVIEPDDSRFFDVLISFAADGDNALEQEFFFTDINIEHITDKMNTQQTIAWKFDRAKSQIIDKLSENQVIIAEIAVPDVARSRVQPADLSFSWIATAYAQASEQQLQALLADLNSGSLSIRRGARDELAQLGPPAVPAMMHAFAAPKASYRTHLGVVVALAQMLRSNNKLAGEVTQSLSEQDLQHLITAVNNNDRTIRVYATEFLALLSDPRIVHHALKMAEEATDDEGRYFPIYTIQNTYDKLHQADQQQVQDHLQKLKSSNGSKSERLINSLQKKWK